jgi:hypothetical protein
MPSLTEGYLSPCPPLSLFGSLHLQPGNKESLGQITLLHVVTFGTYISNILVPWLRWGLSTNSGGTPIATHPMTTLRTWLARTHSPEHPAFIQHQTFFGESTYPPWALFAVSPFSVSRLSTLPLFGYRWVAQVAEGFCSLLGLDPFCHGSQRPLIKKPGPRWPIALIHLA